jgi:hypothetical protein
MLGIVLVLACSKSVETATPAETGTSPTESEPTTSACEGVSAAIAPPRGEMQGVWDDVRRRFVWFGGDAGQPDNCVTQTDFVGDTWAFLADCDAFEELATGDAPGPRGRQGVALDRDGNRMIVHGGRFRDGTSGTYEVLTDLWAFDLTTDTWAELPSAGGPSARHSHVAWSAGGVFYVYGGNASNDGAFYIPLDDLWAYDLAGGEWTELSKGPGERIFASGDVSADGQTLYIYGGTEDFFGPTVGDLWAYDVGSDAWTELHDGSGSAPVERFGPSLAYDPAGDALFLFAGHDTTDLGNTNQLWSFSLASGSWTELSEGDVVDAGGNGFCDFPADFTDPDLGSPERRYLGAAVTAADGELFIFGGKSDCGVLNDVWSWSGGAWTERSSATSGEICLRAFTECSTMCY